MTVKPIFLYSLLGNRNLSVIALTQTDVVTLCGPEGQRTAVNTLQSASLGKLPQVKVNGIFGL
jgi:hypothetical protein